MKKFRVQPAPAPRRVPSPGTRARNSSAIAGNSREASRNQAEIRYQRLFETSQDGILLIDDTSGEILDANPAAERLLAGERAGRLVGRTLSEAGFPMPREGFRLPRKGGGMEVRLGSLTLRDADGKAREIEVSVSRYREGSRAIRQCRIRDVTDRKQVDIALDRLAAIISSSEDAIIAKDLNGIITTWNAGAEKVFGYTAREMVGTPITRLIPEDRLDEENRILASIRAGKSVQHFETVRKTKSGALIDISVTISPIKDADGRVIGASKVARNVTDRKRAEITRNQLAAIIASSQDAIISKNLDGIVTSWNEGARQVFGYSAREMIGKSILKLIPEDRWPEEDRILASIRSGKPIEHFETVRRRKGGRLIDISVTISPIRDDTGRIVGASKVARDITARRKEQEAQFRISALTALNRSLEKEVARRVALEKALQKSHQEQLRLQEQTRSLARKAMRGLEEERMRISRELHDQVTQTLIAAGVQLTSLAGSAATGPEFQRQIRQVQGLLKESAETVHAISRNLRPLLLDDLGLIAALRAHLQTFMIQTGIRASLVAYAEIEKVDKALLVVLYRVAQEALNNVARHSKARSVEVRIEKMGNQVCMTISDDGQGSRKDPFLKSRAGNRLGLLGMRERLEMVGGEFGIESVEGKGTTVTAKIPVDRPPEESAAEEISRGLRTAKKA